MRFRWMNDVELGHLPDPAYLVENMIPMGSFAAFVGQPASKKTFAALNVAFSVASGLPCFGHPTRKGEVVYVAGEGTSGYKNRVESLKRAYGFEGLAGIHFIMEAVNLLDPDQVDALIADIRKLGVAPTLLVFDTLSRCFSGGNENSQDDMSRLVANADRLRKVFDATVIMVHHTRKLGDEYRGSSVFEAALDALLAFRSRGEEDGLVLMECKKLKDAPCPKPLRLRLMDYGASAVLEVVNSAIVEGKPSLDAMDRQLPALLLDKSLTYTTWLAASGRPKSSFKDHLRRLLDTGLIARGDDARYSLTAAWRVEVALDADDKLDLANGEGGPEGRHPKASDPAGPENGGGAGVEDA